MDDDEGLPPDEEMGVFITDRAGETKILPWFHPAIDHLLLPILFSRDDTWVWKTGLRLKEDPADPEEEDVEDVAFDVEEIDQEAENPYADEDPIPNPLLNDEPDNDGEGEQLLLDQEEEYQAECQDNINAETGQEDGNPHADEPKPRYITRTHAARYHMQIRPPPQRPGPNNRNMWHDPHWLFGMRRLFEYYVCLYNNRVEREKHQWIKKKQQNLRYEVPPKLVEGLEKHRQRENSMFSKHFTSYNII